MVPPPPSGAHQLPVEGFPAKLAFLTIAAMVAFAANSVLCRLALENNYIDAISFTSIRLLAGSVSLMCIMLVRRTTFALRPPHWMAVLSLFAYMIFFSFSYRLLSAGTGALILFGAVQMTMIGVALRAGERLSLLAIGGLIIAIGGLVVLLRPGVSVPDPAGALLMGMAGVAWGVYSLRGRGAVDPTAETTINFLYALPFAIMLSVLTFNSAFMSVFGASLAVASGALTSGLGYVIWYTVVPRLGATKAASVQLSVPAIAAVGGVLLLSEPMSLRVIVATILLISGISLVLWNRRRQDKIPQES